MDHDAHSSMWEQPPQILVLMQRPSSMLITALFTSSRSPSLRVIITRHHYDNRSALSWMSLILIFTLSMLLNTTTR